MCSFVQISQTLFTQSSSDEERLDRFRVLAIVLLELPATSLVFIYWLPPNYEKIVNTLVEIDVDWKNSIPALSNLFMVLKLDYD